MLSILIILIILIIYTLCKNFSTNSRQNKLIVNLLLRARLLCRFDTYCATYSHESEFGMVRYLGATGGRRTCK